MGQLFLRGFSADYVKDQFFQPVIGRQVSFSEDDANGTVAPPNDNTDSQGQASTIYTAGTTARQVKITATVQQT